MNNYNISLRINQAFSKPYFNSLKYLGVISPVFNLSDDEMRITPLYLNILKDLLRYIGVYGHTYICHETIAKNVGCHHDTVLKAMRIFKLLKIISIVNRGKNRTCKYSLGEALKDSECMWQLRNILPNLYWAYHNSILAIRKMLPTLFEEVVKAIYKPITARLSNDKNKDIEYKYTRERKEQKSKEFVPTQKDLELYAVYESQRAQERIQLAEEFSKLLGLQT